MHCTITEFKNYCNEKKFLSYVYVTQNQGKFDKRYISAVLIYKSVITSLSPDVIVFQNGRSYMKISMVKHIFAEESDAGTVLRIVCGKNDTDAYDDEYIFVAH